MDYGSLGQEITDASSVGQGASSKSSNNEALLGMVVAGVLGGSILAGVLGMFLYRWHKRYKWDKAVDAALVKDLELGPKINQGIIHVCGTTLNNDQG